MSIAEFGLRPQESLMSFLPNMRMAQPPTESETLAKQYEALSRLSVSLASMTLEELSRNLASLLRPLLDFDFLDVIVFKQGTSEVLWHSVGAGQFAPPDVPVEETTFWWVHQQQQPLCIADWKLDQRFAVRREALKRTGIEYRSLCRLPLRTPQGPLGVFSIASSRPHNYSDAEVRFLSLAADQVALAIFHASNRERSQRAQSELDVQSARLKLLGELTNGVMANLPVNELLSEVTAGIRRVIPSDLAMVGLLDSEGERVGVSACDMAEDNMLAKEAVDVLGEMFGARVFCSGKPWVGNSEESDQVDADGDPKWAVAGFRNSCVVPLAGRDRMLGILALGKHEDTAYTHDEIDYLLQVSSQVAVAVENALVYGELRKLKDNFSEERVCLEDEIRNELNFEEIVGRSSALQRVLRQVEVVAPTDSGVMIQGETGTGKELIARAIHNLSSRRDQPFIKLTVPPFLPVYWKASFLATKRAHSPAPSCARQAGSRLRTRAHCFWMK